MLRRHTLSGLRKDSIKAIRKHAFNSRSSPLLIAVINHGFVCRSKNISTAPARGPRKKLWRKKFAGSGDDNRLEKGVPLHNANARAAGSEQRAREDTPERALAGNEGEPSEAPQPVVIKRHVVGEAEEMHDERAAFEAAVDYARKSARDDKVTRLAMQQAEADSRPTVRWVKIDEEFVRPQLVNRHHVRKRRKTAVKAENAKSSAHHSPSNTPASHNASEIEQEDFFDVGSLEDAIDDITYAPPKSPTTVRKTTDWRELHEEGLPRHRQSKKRPNKALSKGKNMPPFRQVLSLRKRKRIRWMRRRAATLSMLSKRASEQAHRSSTMDPAGGKGKFSK